MRVTLSGTGLDPAEAEGTIPERPQVLRNPRVAK